MKFLVFTLRCEHIATPSVMWTIGIYDSLASAKRASRKYFASPPTGAAWWEIPRVVIQGWSGHRKHCQFERPAGGAWAEVIPF